MEPRFERGLTLQKVLEMVYDDNVDKIFFESSNAGILTDEDSGNENGGGLLDNLSASQLRAAAEVRFINNYRIGGCANIDQHDNISSNNSS
ncbi:hypothetical protein RN001_013339 [Aquatica leii]|uniref:Uncharacterized protein n=1 Tax=Aquatica leii TaxID=1421715 RepID=A0AAN7PQH3_9COLE|nr:hypothetical protein RN001_013339 [Aquatica leii]